MLALTTQPWELLFKGFGQDWFKPLWTPTWQVCVAMLFVCVLFYNLNGRRLRGHRPYEDLNEALMWTSVGVFGTILALAVFQWDFLFVLPTMLIGAFLFIYVRFFRYPSLLEAYEHKLARQRYFQRSRTAHPEATVRPKAAPAGKRKRKR